MPPGAEMMKRAGAQFLAGSGLAGHDDRAIAAGGEPDLLDDPDEGMMLADECGETDLRGQAVVGRPLGARTGAQDAHNAVRELGSAHRREDEIVDQPRGGLQKATAWPEHRQCRMARRLCGQLLEKDGRVGRIGRVDRDQEIEVRPAQAFLGRGAPVGELSRDRQSRDAAPVDQTGLSVEKQHGW